MDAMRARPSFEKVFTEDRIGFYASKGAEKVPHSPSPSSPLCLLLQA